MGYDQEDRLISYADGNSADTASYVYNGDGLRVRKTVNGTTTNTVWNTAEGLPTIIQDGSTKYVTGPDGLPLEQVASNGTTLYYYQDQLGSTRGLVDSAGTVAATFAYGAYGGLTSSTGTATTPFGSAGQYTDAESGFQYLRARYYDPATMQFITRDPLAMQTRRPYAYTPGDPLNATDPTGMCCGLDGLVSTLGAAKDKVGPAIDGVCSVAQYTQVGLGSVRTPIRCAGLCADVAPAPEQRHAGSSGAWRASLRLPAFRAGRWVP